MQHLFGEEEFDDSDQLLAPLAPLPPFYPDRSEEGIPSDFVNFPTRDIRTRAPTPPPFHQVIIILITIEF